MGVQWQARGRGLLILTWRHAEIAARSNCAHFCVSGFGGAKNDFGRASNISAGSRSSGFYQR